MAVDGTQKLTRAALWAAQCLERKIHHKKDTDQENKPDPAKPTAQAGYGRLRKCLEHVMLGR